MLKKNRNVVMSHKAFNGRVIAVYMADCCQRVVDQRVPGNNRIFGDWLQNQVHQGNKQWPSDVEFGLASTCLCSGSMQNSFLMFVVF